MLNICRGKKEPHELPDEVVTTFINIAVPKGRKAIKPGSYRFWIQNSRLFPDFFRKQLFLFPDPRLSNR